MANPLSNIELPVQLLFSFGLGTAARPALEPYAQTLANDAWASHAVRPPDAIILAQGVAQGQVAHDPAYNWAKQQGIGKSQMDALVNVANVGPGASYAFELWRRGLIDKAGFDRALKRLGLEDQWVPGLEGLKDVLLSSEELGMLQQQGFISADRANSEGLLQGVTNERQQLRFEASGLPPGIETALQMLRRGIIGNSEFGQIVREGHTKTKYTDELLKLQDQVLNAAVYVRSFLKGHIDRAGMHAGGALTGYKPADLDLWELSEGRPATVHEIHIGYARGATLPGASSENDAIRTAVAQSDIRPEYADLLIAGKYTYPSAFVLRSLAQAGDLGGQAEVEQVLLEIGWTPKFAAEVSKAWTAPASGGGADPHVAKASTQLWTSTHKSYIGEMITPATATTALEAAGVASQTVPAVLNLWNVERGLVRKQLSPAQIKKAYTSQTVNPATGAAWTLAEAEAELQQRGYDHADAQVLLEE